MADHTQRAGSNGLGISWRANRSVGRRGRALMEPLESRILLSFTPFVDAPRLRRHVSTANFVIGKNATTGPTGFTPAQVRKAYGIDQTFFGSVVGDGTGQTIAIVDAYNAPTIQSDLRTFDAQFGLPDPQLTVINQNGGTVLPPVDPNGRGSSWAVEIALDVEWSHSVAPGAHIVLVEANSPQNSDLNTAITEAKSYPGVSVVSMSFGSVEDSTNLADNAIYTTPAGHNGVTFIASTGDTGAFPFGAAIKAIQYPASSPNVVGIGGTSLTTLPDGTYQTESAWGSGPTSSGGGGGGGISHFEPQPSYQKGIVTQTTTRRAIPDVSFLADPATGVSIYDSYDSPVAPWFTVGGTSLAAPMWAGVIAITNQGRAIAGQPTLDGPSQTLPALYALPSTDYNDIVTGNNGFPATPGYDLATGRGTPIVNLVVRDLVGVTPVTVPTPVPAIGSFTASPTSVTSGSGLVLNAANVTESGGAIAAVIFYRESNGTPGVQPATDTLIGVGTNVGANWAINTSTLGMAAGNYTYYAVATDAAGVSTTATTVVTVSSAPAVNDFFVNATRIIGPAISVTGTNVGASREFKEPVIAKTPGGASVWYAWTAPANGKVTVDTTGSSFDTLLGVYKGSVVSKLKLVAANDDASYFVLTSATAFNAKAGLTYYIAVDGYNGAQGNIDLHLNEVIAAAKRKK